MKIQYIGCHAVLEYDECRLLAQLGYDVYCNGAYRDPRGAYTLPRPGIPEMKFDPEFFELTGLHPKTRLPKEMIDPYDVIVIMSGDSEQILMSNWQNIKHKRVIWRTIGQSTSNTERMVAPLRKEGLQIIRYSPKEKNIPNYCGEDTLIRFYKDPEEFKGWVGDDVRVVNFSQTLKGRRDFLHFDEVMGSIVGHPGSMVYGSGNNDLGQFNGGEIPFEELKKILRHTRAYVYTGTWPASYTLGLIEAMMTGTPVVAISKKIAQANRFEQFEFYEVDEIITDGINGCIGDNVPALRNRIEALFTDPALAKRISEAGRETAIKLFGKETIAQQWCGFLDKGVIQNDSQVA